jgi:glutathione S-transferase
VAATLYAVPASHPCACVEHALRLKAIPYRRVDLLPVLHKPLQWARFGGATVPGLVLDGVRVLGSRPILRLLEARVPEPALLPAAAAERKAVELAETWGDEVLQPLVRRLVWASLSRDPSALPTYSRGARLAIPALLARMSGPPLARAESLINRASDPAVRADLANLDRHAQRVERWIEEGTLGGERPNAADLQIAPSLRLLYALQDVRPLIDGRPAKAFAFRWFAQLPASVPTGALPVQTAAQAATLPAA